MANLNQKLLEIQRVVRGLAKDKDGASYSYVSGSKALGVIRPEMDKQGVLLVPEVIDSSYIRTDYELAGKRPGEAPRQKSEMFVWLKMKFTWIDVESGEKLECLWSSSGMNAWDKGLGSALTYGERYFLLKFFHIATDYDDVDARQDDQEQPALQDALDYVESCESVGKLDEGWAYWAQWFGEDKTFRSAFVKRKRELTNGK